MGSVLNVIQHNMMAMFTDRQLGITGNGKVKSTEKLSSGYKINRAADDAAGLSISEKMRRQIRGLNQSASNAKDGVSLVQTADGALAEVHDMLHRGSELAIKAANGTLSDNDRYLVDQEIQELKREIDHSTLSAKFNELKLFPEDGCRVSPEAAGYVRPEGSVNDPRYNWKTGKFDYQVSFNADGSIGKVVSSEQTDAAEGAGGTGTSSSYSVLADKIINEYVPNAVNQILNTFPSLSTGVDFSSMNMSLDIEYIDGESNKLAFVRGWFYSSPDRCSSLELWVDAADFNSESTAGDSPDVAMLESTLAHELMHAVMDVALPDGMFINGTPGDFTTWFKEGTAQLAGGGFPTNWNSELENYIQNLSSENDDHLDTAIADYLGRGDNYNGKNYTVENRPYGHGYLAAAYIGYLASGSPNVTGANIASGMNSVFQRLRDGETLEDAVKNSTGTELADIVKSINQTGTASENAEAVTFVKKLTYAATANGSKGAGSVITPSLSTGGSAILANTATPASSPLNIDTSKVNYPKTSAGGSGIQSYGNNGISLHVGADSYSSNKVDLLLFRLDTVGLGLEETNTRTMQNAYKAMDEFQGALSVVSFVRSYYGAVQNRLEHTIKNLGNIVENTTSAESAIRDTNMADEMVRFSNLNILQQAGQSMLTQANQSRDFILSLLG